MFANGSFLRRRKRFKAGSMRHCAGRNDDLDGGSDSPMANGTSSLNNSDDEDDNIDIMSGSIDSGSPQTPLEGIQPKEKKIRLESSSSSNYSSASPPTKPIIINNEIPQQIIAQQLQQQQQSVASQPHLQQWPPFYSAITQPALSSLFGLGNIMAPQQQQQQQSPTLSLQSSSTTTSSTPQNPVSPLLSELVLQLIASQHQQQQQQQQQQRQDQHYQLANLFGFACSQKAL